MSIKVADEVWIATALLHQENPDRQSFSGSEIVDRVRRLGLTETVRPGVHTHISQHCVANKKPNPGNYRMLFATANGNRRLFRNGDDCDENRKTGKLHPALGEIPEEYRHLVKWYTEQYYNRVAEALNDLNARRLLRFEQDLPVFRNTYEELDQEDRAKCRRWLEKLMEAGDPPAVLQARILVHIDQVFYSEDGERFDQGSVQLYPRAMLKAVKKWDDDEPFTPNAFGTF